MKGNRKARKHTRTPIWRRILIRSRALKKTPALQANTHTYIRASGVTQSFLIIYLFICYIVFPIFKFCNGLTRIIYSNTLKKDGCVGHPKYWKTKYRLRVVALFAPSSKTVNKPRGRNSRMKSSLILRRSRSFAAFFTPPLWKDAWKQPRTNWWTIWEAGYVKSWGRDKY